jgi:hypothetical protein
VHDFGGCVISREYGNRFSGHDRLIRCLNWA